MASLITCAQPYAQAAFDYAKQHKAVPAWEKAMAALAEIVMNDDMQKVLSLPEIAATQLADMLIELLGKQGDKAIHNFIRVLAEYKKLGLLPVIAAEFQAAKRADEQSVLATLTSAKPIDGKVQKQILTRLEQRFGQKIELTTEIDESLIGGARIQVGDEVIDGSLSGQLNRLRQALGARSQGC